jgi:hypothetical protein
MTRMTYPHSAANVGSLIEGGVQHAFYSCVYASRRYMRAPPLSACGKKSTLPRCDQCTFLVRSGALEP